MVATVACRGQSVPGESPIEARHGFRTHLLRNEQVGAFAELPPRGVLTLVHFPAPLGRNAAYLSPAPQDGKKHPAVIWLAGGFSNSIGAVAWEPADPSNDQSAAQLRTGGILVMYPSLRGGNNNPGFRETFFGEVDDVLAAINYVAALPDVDSHRIYVGGHSTGGTLALLVAESASPGQLRAAFSLGPVGDVRGYGAGVLPFDLNDPKEGDLRAPIRYLGAISCPTFVFEGTVQPSNIMSLRMLERKSSNPLIHFESVPGKTHFSEIVPTLQRVAGGIVADGADAARFQLAPTPVN